MISSIVLLLPNTDKLLANNTVMVNWYSTTSIVLKCRLSFTSVAYIQDHFYLDSFLEANTMSPDQTVSLSLIWVHIVCKIGYIRT